LGVAFFLGALQPVFCHPEFRNGCPKPKPGAGDCRPAPAALLFAVNAGPIRGDKKRLLSEFCKTLSLFLVEAFV